MLYGWAYSTFADFKYLGSRRCFVACSNANAMAINCGSLHAVPTNEIPTGKPRTNPAGTVMWDNPRRQRLTKTHRHCCRRE